MQRDETIASGNRSSATSDKLPVPQFLQLALQHHQAGRLLQAEELYRQILQADPNHPDALYLLGSLAYQAGNNETAFELNKRAIRVQPDNPVFHNSLGAIYQALSRLDEAVTCYKKALLLKPDQVDAHYNLGTVLQAQGKQDAAIASYQKALALKPDHVFAHNNLGNIFKAQGKLNEAEACYKRAISLNPKFVGAHNNLGNVLKDQGKLEEAIDCYQKSLAINPSFAETLSNLGVVLHAQGKLEEAIKYFQQAISFDPAYAEAYNNLGAVFKDQGKLFESIDGYRKAISIKPGYAEAHYNIGNVLKDQGKLYEAEESYRTALVIKPDFVDAHCNYGMMLHLQGRLEAAIKCLQQALSFDQNCTEAYQNLGNVLKGQGKLGEAIDSYRKAILIKPDYAEAYDNLLMVMHYSPKFTPPEIFAEYICFAEKFEAPLKPFWPIHQNLREPGKRLKVGYVSGDFRNHVVTNFIEPILANHDKSQVEVFCYSNHTLRDSVTDRIIALTEHWIPCKKLSDEQLVERIRSDGIDILVDLSGHTAHNRLLTFARKPAPIQVTWLGYPGTTGLSAMDYRLTDRHMDPEGMTEQYHTETLVRLPCSAAFQPASASPPVNELPALTSSQFTLACMNNLVKINDEVARFWARIMVALPQARLMLGNVMDDTTRQRLIDLFAQEGIAAVRLVLHPTMSLSDYLALHHQIDLALDPFPYNGGTSTYHSLWMGVPVITLEGNYSASRVGVAIMEGIGLTEFVTSSTDEYFELVLSLAKDLPGLDQLRQSLRQRIATQSAADPLRLTRSLEKAFRNMWNVHEGSSVDG